MKTIVIALGLVLLAATAVIGQQDYSAYNGYQADGYVFQNGYWYAGTQAYTRQRVETAGYWLNGCYVQGTYRYVYTAYQAPKPAATVSYTDPDWRIKLLEIAAARDKQEQQIRKGAFEQAYFVEAVKTLGLEGNFRLAGYGTVPPYAIAQPGQYYPGTLQGSAYSQVVNYGANASTGYGIGQSYANAAQLYNSNDLALLVQGANQHVQNSQRLSGDALAGFQALIASEGTNRARVAEILARGQMASQVLQALNGPPTSETKGFSFKVTPGGIERMEENVPPEAKKALSEKWITSATNRCAACHGGADKTKWKGGFNVADYPTMDMAGKQKVWMRLTLPPNDKQMMPRAADGGPGEPLKPDELRVWFLN